MSPGPTKLHPETLRLTLGSVWFSPVKLGWKVGEWKYITPGEDLGEAGPNRNGLRYDWLGLETGKISNLVLDDIQLQLTAMIFQIQPIIPSVCPFEYCEIQHRDRNSEAQIATKKKEQLAIGKIIQLLKKKTLEICMYIYIYIYP